MREQKTKRRPFLPSDKYSECQMETKFRWGKKWAPVNPQMSRKWLKDPWALSNVKLKSSKQDWMSRAYANESDCCCFLNGPFPASFLYFCLFNKVDSKQMFHIKVWRWLDLNLGPLVSFATALTAESQPLPSPIVVSTVMSLEYNNRALWYSISSGQWMCPTLSTFFGLVWS